VSPKRSGNAIDKTQRSQRKGKKGKKKGKGAVQEQEAFCRRCNSVFDSRTALFKHLEETGHAIATGIAGPSGGSPPPQKAQKGKKGKKGRKGRS